MLFNNKKEWDTDTCYYMGEIWKHYTKWMKLFTKDNIFYDSIKKNVQNNQICRERNTFDVAIGSKEKQENSRKTSTAASLTTLKPLTVWIPINCKIFKEMGIPDHLTCLLRNLYKGQEATEPDMEQWPGSKLGKKYIKAVYRHPDYLTYMQSTACKMSGWMKHKLESRLLRETSITLDIQMTLPLWQKEKRN